MNNFKSLAEARRAIRLYDSEKELNSAIVKECIQTATLAPSSSNLQLWEFYHIINKEKLKELSTYCFDQLTARTAKEMVVVVTRKDLWKKRCESNARRLKEVYGKDGEYNRREKNHIKYFEKLIPTLYRDFFRLFGYMKYFIFTILGIFRPVYREVTHNDIRVVAHKSTALAAQTFMLAMKDQGYDTCPMEGIDSLRVKRMLKLPHGAEINMVISCGIADTNGPLLPRYRVDFDSVYQAL